MRVYLPATVRILRDLVDRSEFRPLGGTAFAVTPALREAYVSGDDEELAEVAMAEAARAAIRLLAAEADGPEPAAADTAAEVDGAPPVVDPDGAPVTGDTRTSGDTPEGGRWRRAVIAADIDEVTARPDLDDAVVRIAGVVPFSAVASVHLDLADARDAVRRAAEVIDAADLGDVDAEFVLGDAEDHQLAWYAPQELQFVLDLM